MKGSVVVLGPRWSPAWPVVRHPPEVLGRSVSALVVAGMEVVDTPSFGFRMPVIIGPMSPVVAVIAVLVVRSFPRGAVVAVAARAAVRVTV